MKTSIAAWSALFAIGGFLVAHAVLNDDGVRDLAYALVTGFASAGVVRYGPDALRSFRTGRAGAEFLIIGVASLLTTLLFHRAWVMTITYFPWMEYPIITYFVVWMLAWACSLILLAPDVEAGVIANRGLVLFGAALFIAGMMAGVSLTLSLR